MTEIQKADPQARRRAIIILILVTMIGCVLILVFEHLRPALEDWIGQDPAELGPRVAVFLAGFERAFLLFMDSCCFCKDCSGNRETCEQPRMARPAPEAMAVDVYTTVRKFGFEINVRTDYDQKMDRFAFLMVH